jgi:hypothetical protein
MTYRALMAGALDALPECPVEYRQALAGGVRSV